MEDFIEDDTDLVSCEILPDYRIIAMIDYGSFGDIYKAKHISDNKVYAIKQLKFRGNSHDDPYIFNELYCLTHIQHKNIIKMHNVIFGHNQINIVMEYAVNENLERYMEKVGGDGMEYCMKHKIYSQVLHGVQHCHALDIAHRDLNPSNILLSNDMVVKIADFGLAVRCFSDDGDPVYCKDYLGRLSYLAPEVLQKKPFLPKPSDIWSLGAILIYLLFYSIPFTGFDEDVIEDQRKETWKCFIKQKCDERSHHLKDNIFSVILSALALDSTNRDNICGLVRRWDDTSPDCYFVKSFRST